MAHERQLIRDAVVTALIGAEPGAFGEAANPNVGSLLSSPLLEAIGTHLFAGLVQPPAPMQIKVLETGTEPQNGRTIVIEGTDVDDAPITESLVRTSPEVNPLVTTLFFKTLSGMCRESCSNASGTAFVTLAQGPLMLAQGPTTYATAAGARVTKTRIEPQPEAQLPAISVYTNDETTAKSAVAPRELKRTVQVVIDGWVVVSAGGEIDDALDDLCLEIETAMDVDVNFRTGAELEATAFDSWLISTEFAVAINGERPMGCARMVYEVDYHSDQRIGPVEDTFDTADVKFEDLDGDGVKIFADNQAHDTVTGIYQE